MRRKLYGHLVSTNYNGIKEKIKQQSKTKKRKTKGTVTTAP